MKRTDWGFLKAALSLCSKIASVLLSIESLIIAFIGRRNIDVFVHQILRISFIRSCFSSFHRLLIYLSRGGIIVLPHKKAFAFVWLPEGVKFIVPDHHSILHIISIWRKCTYDLPLNLRDWHKNPRIKGSTVLDIGAHIGIYTVRASKLVEKEGVVIAVEPCFENFEYLEKNLALNNCKNVIPIDVALNSNPGEVKLFLSNRSSASHSMILKRSGKFVRVQAITLDHLVKDLRLNSIDFIKINAEGATLEILKGGEETLRIHKPQLVLSVGHYPEEKEEAVNFLANRGYFTSTEQRLIHAFPIEIKRH